MILSIDIKNGRNGDDNDRSTKDIGLYISNCGSGWIEVASDTLDSGINKDCDQIPVQNYPVNKMGRFVRFVAVNFYGLGSVLQYFHVNVDYPNGVEADPQFLCPSMSIMMIIYYLYECYNYFPFPQKQKLMTTTLLPLIQ